MNPNANNTRVEKLGAAVGKSVCRNNKYFDIETRIRILYFCPKTSYLFCSILIIGPVFVDQYIDYLPYNWRGLCLYVK